jgi:pilus assembly protein CpaB
MVSFGGYQSIRPSKVSAMNAARVIVLVVALAAGGLAAMLASRSDAPPPPPPAPVVAQIDTTEVLVAKDDVGVGQTLSAENMSWQTWPAANTGAQFIQKKNKPDAINEMSGSIVRIAFAGGEPIREAKVIKAGTSGYIAALLPAGMRAIAMEISPEAGAGGFILPNDHVDVILTRAEKLSQEEFFTAETILADVRILAIDQTVEEKNGQRVIVGKIATLALSPRQTETLALARRMGALSLALRGLRDVNQPTADGGDNSVANRQSINVVRYGRGTSTFK